MKILLIDHACHAATKSLDFFRDLLAARHAVELVRYTRHYHCAIPAEKVAWADVVVFWEFLPFRFACGIPGKRCVFVPMYDNEWGSRFLWRRLALLGMNAICFCRRLADHARACGVGNVLEVAFAFDPAAFPNESGDPRLASFWDRGDISEATARALFAPEAIDSLLVKRGFLSDEAYADFLSRPGVFVAPRRREGIGMAFLEQLARGKCVIAPDDATMNEYITNGVDGILFDPARPRPIAAEEIKRVRRNVRVSAERHFARWCRDRARILEFFDRLPAVPPLASPWSRRSLVLYALYWLEGAWMRCRAGRKR